MSNKYVAIITGPKEYLKEGILLEKFEITQEEIEECKEEGESDEQTIEYILEEYANEWGQRWCSVQLLTLGQYRIINPTFEW